MDEIRFFRPKLLLQVSATVLEFRHLHSSHGVDRTFQPSRLLHDVMDNIPEVVPTSVHETSKQCDVCGGRRSLCVSTGNQGTMPLGSM